jgi:hypothetical protein
VQRDAVEAKAGEAADAYAKFMRVVGDDWDLVKDGLEITLGDWKEMELEEQWQHLANQQSPPMDVGKAQELAREINKLLGISECRVQDGGSASPTSARSCARLSVPWHPQPWSFALLGKGGGTRCVPGSVLFV